MIDTTDLHVAVDALLKERLVIYPTETLYAIGCLATHHTAVEHVVAAKGRPSSKPLPLIVGDWEMVERFLLLDRHTEEMVRIFWPSSLSVITKVSTELSPLTQDAQGRSAVRMSPHPIARELCIAAMAPLVSSSANRSGMNACAVPDLLDQELVRNAGAVVVTAQPWPEGGLPSTLVEVVERRTVRVLRWGRVRAADLREKGYDIL